MKHPEGALKTIFELKQAAVPGAVFYMVFGNEPQQAFKLIINEGFKVKEDHTNRRWTFVIDISDFNGALFQGHAFWSPYGDLCFPTSPNKCGFLFNNYWHAYAYRLKLEKAA